ncbi:MAG: matrixin family metalloprotease, partial [Gammaproteobacteria bacterium]
MKFINITMRTACFISWCACITATLLPAQVQAGAYIFAGEANGVDLVTHPNTYTGSGGTVTVRVCIAPTSPNAIDMEYSVQQNIDIYNQLIPTTDNLKLNNNNNIPDNTLDFESVALHEIGHCLGMAHINAASESKLPSSKQNYTKATNGPDPDLDPDPDPDKGFNLDAGADGIIGSSDDIRGNDENLVWFRISNNDPFTIDSVID